MSGEDLSAGDARWDEAKAAAIVGARVVIGLTFAADEPTRFEQRHGTVVAAQRGQTIDIALAGAHAGEVLTLPPDTTAFQPAAPGNYKLRSTGEVVINPEFTVTYTVHAATRD